MCNWKGTFKELLSSHLSQCAKRNDPSFVLKIEIKKLTKETEDQKQMILALQRENEDLKREINKNAKDTKFAMQLIHHIEDSEITMKHRN